MSTLDVSASADIVAWKLGVKKEMQALT